MELQTILFGGTFDPVHVGHLIIARDVAEQFGAGRVLLLPTGVNPLKDPPVASAEDRLAMLRLAAGDEPGFKISEAEIHRPPPHYTVETVEQLRRSDSQGTLGRIGLLIGADLIDDLPAWHRVEDLLGLVHPLIACRPPTTAEQMQQRIGRVQEEIGGESAKKISQALVETRHIDISSTQVRNRCRQELSVRYLVPQAVAEYIREMNIYSMRS
jgi:nicotinate-nucleotide adenylyltransferase